MLCFYLMPVDAQPCVRLCLLCVTLWCVSVLLLVVDAQQCVLTSAPRVRLPCPVGGRSPSAVEGRPYLCFSRVGT